MAGREVGAVVAPPLFSIPCFLLPLITTLCAVLCCAVLCCGGGESRSDASTRPIGLAFSGGGIRSAAFCLGVLLQFTAVRTPPLLVSCFFFFLFLTLPCFCFIFRFFFCLTLHSARHPNPTHSHRIRLACVRWTICRPCPAAATPALRS